MPARFGRAAEPPVLTAGRVQGWSRCDGERAPRLPAVLIRPQPRPPGAGYPFGGRDDALSASGLDTAVGLDAIPRSAPESVPSSGPTPCDPASRTDRTPAADGPGEPRPRRWEVTIVRYLDADWSRVGICAAERRLSFPPTPTTVERQRRRRCRIETAARRLRILTASRRPGAANEARRTDGRVPRG